MDAYSCNAWEHVYLAVVWQMVKCITIYEQKLTLDNIVAVL
jgi:hypothetical protein